MAQATEWRFRPANPWELLGHPQGRRRGAHRTPRAQPYPPPPTHTHTLGQGSGPVPQIRAPRHLPGLGEWLGSRYSHPRPWPPGGSLHHLLEQCVCLGVFAEAAAWPPASKTLPLGALLSGGGRGRRTKARWGRDTAGPRGLETREALWGCGQGQWAGARAGVGFQGWGWEPALRLGTGRASRSLLLWPWPLRGGTHWSGGWGPFRPHNGALCAGRGGAGAPTIPSLAPSWPEAWVPRWGGGGRGVAGSSRLGSPRRWWLGA